MGKIDFYPIIQFASANGTATNPVDIQVYAWAENVKLAGNTVNLALQARDEYGSGPVSRPASVIAGIARRLTDVPVLGRFAKATHIGATALGSIASLFGFTNVPVIDNVQPFKNQPFHGFASSQIGVPIEKLTLDPKNELTIDPTVAGLPAVDELAISYISAKPALLRVVRWDQSDAVDYSLFRANITPTLCRTIGSAPSQEYVDCPMGYIARQFSNWRGDIMIRIVIIKSEYHQGRVRVTYDPTGDIFSDSNSETITNTKIIDIQNTDYVEFRIPWMQAQSWLRVIPTIVRDNGSRGDTNSTYSTDYHNGRFEVRVLNRLTGPNTTSNVNFAFYAYAADNFELANPSDFNTRTSVFRVQSEDEVLPLTMGKSTPRPDHLLDVNFGEDIRSMRPLMRRTTFHMTEGVGAAYTMGAFATRAWTIEFRKNIYPLCYGFDPLSDYNLNRVTTTGTLPGNNCNETPYTWMSVCYVGQRGSMNYAFDQVGQDVLPSLMAQRYNEPFPSGVGGVVNTSLETSGNPRITNQRSLYQTGTTGMCLQNERTQTGLQFSVPCMTKYRFMSTNPANRAIGADIDDSENNNFVVRGSKTIYTPVSNTQTVSVICNEYHGIGVDYTPLWFLSTPRRWIYDTTTDS
jgi:hypothetical protein